MELKDFKKAGIKDKDQLRGFRMAERLRLLRKYYKLLYAAYRELGEKKFELMLSVAAKLNVNSTSAYELEKVANYVGCDPDELQQKTRNRDIVEARQVAMYLSKRNTKESLAKIGRTIGNKDHATVLHACRTVNNLLETNPGFRDKWMPLLTAQ
ncbi:helix-turn-helix domain-containing protein [Maribellus mangrovi]|uniref:helix-turn-helix domain-containing protein n=1 Tax=Maribellus mangrovi TaxID=3133146 RepID=UPI0030EDBF6B